LFYDKNCISCVASESYSLYTDDSYGSMVYPVCNELYDTSAQCNRHLSHMDGSDTYEVRIVAIIGVNGRIARLCVVRTSDINIGLTICYCSVSLAVRTAGSQRRGRLRVCGFLGRK
jgi:hypothetical protein